MVLDHNGQWVRVRRRSRRDYLLYREHARVLVETKARYFSACYGLAYGRISVKNQKRLWGSCSRKGNLNFNYRILFMPERVQDYIIVHEICHLKEFNHSMDFWRLVALTVPEYARLRAHLKRGVLPC